MEYRWEAEGDQILHGGRGEWNIQVGGRERRMEAGETERRIEYWREVEEDGIQVTGKRGWNTRGRERRTEYR
jgi:hypothetical protein